jgi:2-(1,2-epoxy-1,2-dihydrophenyl)acetyl-CoA isomerase
MNYETIRLAKNEGIATITLNRPESLNAFDFLMAEELLAALQACRQDDSVRVVILGGEGRAFSAAAT